MQENTDQNNFEYGRFLRSDLRVNYSSKIINQNCLKQ